ncbi:MAG: stage II sporulation protein M [Nanoarchaeota archaeon]
MIEMLIGPRKAERQPWELFFVGLFYASISLLLVSFVFSKDSVLKDYGGILVVTFTVMCSFPFVYYIIKFEEGKDLEISKTGKLLKEHSKAIKALMWLFLGFVIAFSAWYILLPGYTSVNFNAQIKIFCAINNPENFDYCIEKNGISPITGNVAKGNLMLNIIANNIHVLIFTIIFSLAFGAGAIFILAWNASVIAAAVGIFSDGNFLKMPVGIFRYMIHGFPEIASYFLGALAGGIISVAIIRKDLKGERLWKILEDSLLLIILSIVILVIAGFIEVFITPKLF